MRVFPDKTQDEEFKALRAEGRTGALNDMQYSYLRSKGRSGSLGDMFGDSQNLISELFSDGAKGLAWNMSSPMFQDEAGTVVSGLGDPVCLITDLSGNGYDVVQNVNSSFRPTLMPEWLEFDRVDDFMNIPLDLSSSRWLMGMSWEHVSPTEDRVMFLHMSGRYTLLAHKSNTATTVSAQATLNKVQFGGVDSNLTSRDTVYTDFINATSLVYDVSLPAGWNTSRIGVWTTAATYSTPTRLKAMVVKEVPTGSTEEAFALVNQFLGDSS